MRTILLMGAIGAGKSTLLRALADGDFQPRRAMAVERHGRFILTPGEFLENRRFYHALISTSADCGLLLFLQDACSAISLYPPRFAAIFNRRVLGVATKMDAPGANEARARRFLHAAGAATVLPVSAATGQGLDTLRGMLPDLS